MCIALAYENTVKGFSDNSKEKYFSKSCVVCVCVWNNTKSVALHHLSFPTNIYYHPTSIPIPGNPTATGMNGEEKQYWNTNNPQNSEGNT